MNQWIDNSDGTWAEWDNEDEDSTDNSSTQIFTVSRGSGREHHSSGTIHEEGDTWYRKKNSKSGLGSVVGTDVTEHIKERDSSQTGAGASDPHDTHTLRQWGNQRTEVSFTVYELPTFPSGASSEFVEWIEDTDDNPDDGRVYFTSTDINGNPYENGFIKSWDLSWSNEHIEQPGAQPKAKGEGEARGTGTIEGGIAGGKKLNLNPPSSASWWNPIDLAARLIYTGDAFASDSDYAAAQAGAGDSYNENKVAAHARLDNVAIIDKVGLADATNGSLYLLEGDSDAAAAAFASIAFGLFGGKGKPTSTMGFADDVGEQVAKQSDTIGTAAKKVEMPGTVATKVGVGSANGRYLADNWHQGTFPNRTQTVSYHLAKHGKGRSATEYTRDAMDFFQKNRHLGQDVILRDGSAGIKIQTKVSMPGQKTQKIGGYWTSDGRLVTFWD